MAVSEKTEEDIENILKNYPLTSRDQLIPILQEVQEAKGYLPRKSIERIGEYLNLPVSKVYGVATFYDQFRFKPPGKYKILICRGTACHIKGSETVLQSLESILNIKAGNTTEDGLFSLEIVSCIGACGLAPVININGKFYSHVSKNGIENIVTELRKKDME